MSDHYTFFSHVLHDASQQKFAMALIIGGGLVCLGWRLSQNLKSEADIENAIVPREKITLKGFVDFAIEAFAKYQDSILGKENRRFLPFTASLFFFILLSNLLGLIPGLPASTTTVWVTVGLALTTFMFFNLQGVRANGLIGYLKHFCGPVVLLAPIIFPLEIISTTIRILTLNLRLYWNLSADHMVLGLFIDLAGIGIPVIFYLLGTFVCFMQAFVFTTLTMVYILLATHHEEAH